MSARSTLAVTLLVVGVAGCGLDRVSAGVEVVSIVDRSGRSDVPAASGRADAGSGVGASTEGMTAIGAQHEGEPIEEPPSAMPTTVAVVGDSLTLSAADEIEDALTQLGVEVLVVDGLENRRMVDGGRSLPPGVDAIDEVLEAGIEPELWIIALGTNDVGSDVSEESFRDDVVEVLVSVPAGAPVIWVDLWIRDRTYAVIEANRAIRSVIALRPATSVVDWYGYGDDPGIITSDGVHLTDAGERLFAASMVSGVEAMFAG